MVFLAFFSSSRRRHTRWPRDWSSDVCSSDLIGPWGASLRKPQASFVLTFTSPRELRTDPVDAHNRFRVQLSTGGAPDLSSRGRALLLIVGGPGIGDTDQRWIRLMPQLSGRLDSTLGRNHLCSGDTHDAASRVLDSNLTCCGWI